MPEENQIKNDAQRLAETGVSVLRGVGAARVEAYARLGISTLYDLICHFPRAYENRGDTILLRDATGEKKESFLLTVATVPRIANIRRQMSLLKFRAFDDSGACEIVYFNQNYMAEKFTVGAEFRFTGKVERRGSAISLANPIAERCAEGTGGAELAGLVPIYPATEGLSQAVLTANIQAAQALLLPVLPDTLEADLRARHNLCTLSFAIRTMHAPESYTALGQAKRRLIFEEFFQFGLGMGTARRVQRQTGAPVCSFGDISSLLALLPYTLTNAQQRAIEDVRRDMASDTAMNRIVVGDVGCGKTMVAAAAIFIAVRSGRQAALMAPTEILARQHYAELSALFAKLGIETVLLVGATTPAQKKKIYAGLASSDPATRIPVVIGTEALLSSGVAFAAPGLVVTDEQHRFGVEQRALFSQKNGHAHQLLMSATPIPRSLALVMYGGLDISKIDEMPPGRQRVDTFVVNESYRDRLNAFIQKQVALGGQVYVVCPAVEEDEEIDENGDETYGEGISLSDITETGEVIPKKAPLPLKAAVQFADMLALALPGLSVAFMHGKMKTKEKDGVMKRFAAGEIQVLVSTTVIEVGVNVPNATLMIVENADRFGLSQLHQLRGRVGRGFRKSFCVLVTAGTKDPGERARKRLETMRTTYDGFLIAEQDLAQRGPGDFLRHTDASGIRQSGGMRFRLGDLCNDSGLMNEAFAQAKELLAADPDLTAHPDLRKTVDRLFSVAEDTIN